MIIDNLFLPAATVLKLGVGSDSAPLELSKLSGVTWGSPELDQVSHRAPRSF